MKRMKNIITMLTVAVMLFLLPQGSCLKVSADEPATYAVKYVDGEWVYQENRGDFDDSGSVISWQVYQLRDVLKAGDTVVVYNEEGTDKALDLGTTRFNNLTVATKTFTVIYTGGIQDCHILSGCTASVNGDITNAHVYDNSVVNFGGNLQLLNIHSKDKITSSVSVGGTVAHLYAPSDTLPRTFYDLYDFQAGSLIIDEDGDLNTPEWKFSREAPAAQQPETQAPAETPQPQPAPQAPAASGNADEYDAVPKTGESNSVIWLLCLAALCTFGCAGLRKAGK